MREIKFRVWCKNKNEWEQDMPVLTFDGRLIDLQHHMELNQENHIVMQYTGLRDKNDKEIFEGDIVKVNCPYSFKLEVGTICYNDGCFDIIGNTGGRDYLKCHTANHAVKVIGNIYDNPELLEGTTK